MDSQISLAPPQQVPFPVSGWISRYLFWKGFVYQLIDMFIN